MYMQGLLIGICAYVIIGLFHPIVIKSEYYFSSRIWPVFLIAGLAFLALSLCMVNVVLSSIFSILGFTCFWSIHELKEQSKRVAKGWFPANPKRKKE